MRLRSVLVATILVLSVVGPAVPAQANHPVYVEGNCDSPVPGTTLVNVAGTCGDYDGDGRIGTAEDTDGADRVFGTLTAALGPGTGAAAGTGANQNGTIIIVASGRFAETLAITPGTGTFVDGTVTIEAIPGVSADIDAVLQGDPAGGNNTRQDATGITITAGAGSRVILRNLEIRNFTNGIEVTGNSHVTLDDVRLSSNVGYGILVRNSARVAIVNSSVIGTGFRSGPADDSPVPGVGIEFRATSKGIINFTTVTGSVAAGIRDAADGTPFSQSHNTLFDNMPNVQST